MIYIEYIRDVTYSSFVDPDKKYYFIKKVYNEILYSRYCFVGMNFGISEEVKCFLSQFGWCGSPYNTKFGSAIGQGDRNFFYRHYHF